MWEVVGGEEIFSTAQKCLLHSPMPKLKLNWLLCTIKNKSHGHLVHVYENPPLIIGRVKWYNILSYQEPVSLLNSLNWIFDNCIFFLVGYFWTKHNSLYNHENILFFTLYFKQSCYTVMRTRLHIFYTLMKIWLYTYVGHTCHHGNQEDRNICQ